MFSSRTDKYVILLSSINPRDLQILYLVQPVNITWRGLHNTIIINNVTTAIT